MNPNNGGPAFPMLEREWSDSGYRYCMDGGMTLRDYFAAKSLVLCPNNRYEYQLCAEWSYRMADAMLKARGEP